MYLGTAASNTKFVKGTSPPFLNEAVTTPEPSASRLREKRILKLFFSKATIGANCAAACGGAAPPKMSKSPRSTPPLGAEGAAATVGAGFPRRSRRSPPEAGAGAGALTGAAAGVSRRSLRSNRFVASPAAGPAEVGAPAAAPAGTSSMEVSPVPTLLKSRSGTGILSRIPERFESHSDSRISKNSQDRCCKSALKLVSNFLSIFRILSYSVGHRVTSLTAAEATKACVAAAFSATGGFFTTSCSKSMTSLGATLIG
mmetsp:Transcript_2491/g.7355  ORF Transcript_2491/g.7355 Transcript_2491/m.7355 type:complete len:257 (-) Transcript_2491:1548-2318(-)